MLYIWYHVIDKYVVCINLIKLSVCWSLLFDVLQRTSPYIGPRGRVVPGCLVILEQTVPWTGSTPCCCGLEDSVRCHWRDKQQSGGSILEEWITSTTCWYSIWRTTECGVFYLLNWFIPINLSRCIIYTTINEFKRLVVINVHYVFIYYVVGNSVG